MWIYINLREFMWIYMNLRKFTCIYLRLSEFTWIYLDLPWFILIYLDLPEYTWIYLNLPEFTVIEFTSIEGDEEIPCVHTNTGFLGCLEILSDLLSAGSQFAGPVYVVLGDEGEGVADDEGVSRPLAAKSVATRTGTWGRFGLRNLD